MVHGTRYGMVIFNINQSINSVSCRVFIWTFLGFCTDRRDGERCARRSMTRRRRERVGWEKDEWAVSVLAGNGKTRFDRETI